MEPNKLGLDQERADDGLETHHLNWLAFWRPTRRTLLRSFSGYDLRQIDDEPLSTYQQRKWDPWTTELTYSATSRTSYFFRYALSYYPLKSQLWEALYNVKGPYRSYWNTGLLYNKGAPGKLTWNNRFGLYVSPGWRIDATLDSLVPNSSVKDVLKLGDLINEELSIVRDLHCWQARFNYRNTPPFAHTYMFMLDLKLGVEAEKRIANEDLESQYYPWRARGTSRY
jgi:hypothetical protein